MRALCLLVVLACTGCGGSGELRVDGSSDAALKSSLDAIRRTLPASELKQFEDDILTVSVGDSPFSLAVPGSVESLARANLDGKTIADIRAEAARQREEATKMIEGLMKSK